jgi:hypothetical protein
LNHHGYKCLDLATGKVYVSRHVVFYENNFPYKNPAQTPSIFQDSDSIMIPFSNTISPLSLTSTGSHAPSASSHNDSRLPVSSSSSDPAHQPPTCTFPNLPSIPVLNPTPTILAISNAHPMVTRSKKNISKQKRTPDGKTLYPLPQALHVSTSLSFREPTSFTEASKSYNWLSATNVEFDALL